MGEAGLFSERARVELLDGEIINMSPIGRRHWQAQTNLTELLIEQSRRRYLVGPESPVEADEHSELEPDVIVAPRSCKTAKRLPYTHQAHLIIEISDSTLRYDRGRKLRKYASTGVPEYWIVNLQADVIEVHREPVGDSFSQVSTHALGEAISPLAFPDVVIPVGEIIPAR